MTNIHEKRKTSMLIDNLVYTWHEFQYCYKANSRIDDGEKNNQKSIFINPSDLLHHPVSY
jgi:hypothetical protein